MSIILHALNYGQLFQIALACSYVFNLRIDIIFFPVCLPILPLGPHNVISTESIVEKIHMTTWEMYVFLFTFSSRALYVSPLVDVGICLLGKNHNVFSDIAEMELFVILLHCWMSGEQFFISFAIWGLRIPFNK